MRHLLSSSIFYSPLLPHLLLISLSPPVPDNNNKTDIFDKLDYYRKNLEVARRVAVRGYLHSMTHHRAANLLDYVLRVSRQVFGLICSTCCVLVRVHVRSSHCYFLAPLPVRVDIARLCVFFLASLLLPVRLTVNTIAVQSSQSLTDRPTPCHTSPHRTTP